MASHGEASGVRIAVDCSGIVPGLSCGIENFTYGLLSAFKESPHSYVVVIPAGTRSAWVGNVSDDSHLTFVEAPALASIVQSMARMKRANMLRGVYGTMRKSSLLRRLLSRMRRDRVAKLIESVSPDITYQPFHHDRRVSGKSVVTVHDMGALRGGVYDPSVAEILIDNIHQSDALVVSWPHPFGELIGMFPRVVDKAFMIPFPLPITPRITRAHGRVARNADNCDLVLYAALTAKHKNHMALVKAMPHVLARRAVRLVCAGTLISPFFEEARQAAVDLGMASSIDFVGYVPSQELAGLYTSASMVVAPTLWEAASGTVFEAFLFGKAVACSDIPPLRSQVEYVGGGARFFDPLDPAAIAEAIIDVLENRESYEGAARRAGSTLQRLDWRTTASAYLEVFDWVSRGAPKDRRPQPASLSAVA